MKRCLLLLTLSMFSLAPAGAADLGGYKGREALRCYGLHHQFSAEFLPKVSQAVTEYHDRAVSIAETDPDVFINAVKATWVDETKVWCGVSIGYFKKGYYDNEAVNRCICSFHYMSRY